MCVLGIIINSSLKFSCRCWRARFAGRFETLAKHMRCGGQCQSEANGTSTFRTAEEIRNDEEVEADGKKYIFVRCLENWNRQTNTPTQRTTHPMKSIKNFLERNCTWAHIKKIFTLYFFFFFCFLSLFLSSSSFLSDYFSDVPESYIVSLYTSVQNHYCLGLVFTFVHWLTQWRNVVFLTLASVCVCVWVWRR